MNSLKASEDTNLATRKKSSFRSARVSAPGCQPLPREPGPARPGPWGPGPSSARSLRATSHCPCTQEAAQTWRRGRCPRTGASPSREGPTVPWPLLPGPQQALSWSRRSHLVCPWLSVGWPVPTPCPAVPAGSSGWRPPTCLSQFNPWLADGPDRLTSRPALWVTPGVRAPLGVLALPAPHGQTELLRGGHTPVT